jgi:hypothetical protein
MKSVAKNPVQPQQHTMRTRRLHRSLGCHRAGAVKTHGVRDEVSWPVTAGQLSSRQSVD